MNRTEHLLVCLAEECAEVAHAVGKALRFGLNDKGPNHLLTNAQCIARELVDIIAVTEMLEEIKALPTTSTMLDIEAKKEKVRVFMHYAQEAGTLTNEANT